SAIRIGSPVNWMKVLHAINESHGTAETVSDKEILEAQRNLASKEGIFVEPASAASIAGLRKNREAGKIDRSDLVVCVTIGNGLNLDRVLKVKEKYGTVQKYPATVEGKTSIQQIISSAEAEAVIETTPSNFENGEPGLTNIKNSLSARRHVVTSNKGPLALAMP